MKHHLFGNKSIHNRIWIIVVLFITGTILAHLIDASALRDSLLREKTAQTRHLVESGYSILAHYQGLQASGKLSEAEAKKIASETIRSMRYGDNEYFWLNDTGQPFPKMIMHPLQPELEGKTLESEKFNSATQVSYGDSENFVNTDGPKNLFIAFADVANRSGYGFVRYEWYKQTNDGVSSATKYSKLSFIKKFEPWGWIIGSGIYIDDIDEALSLQSRHQLIRATLLCILLLIVAGIIAQSTRKIELDLKNSQVRMQALIDATSETVLLLDHKGEIQAINQFGAQRFTKKPEDLLGENFFAMLPKSLANSRQLAVEQVIATAEPITLNDERNGIQFENSIYPVYDAKGLAVSVAVYAKDITEQHQEKAIAEIFRHLDMVLLKWQMNTATVAQIFCDNILPVFNLAAAWIGKAERDGRITIVAQSEMVDQHFLDSAELPLHWNQADTGWPPVPAVIRSGYRQISEVSDSLVLPHSRAAINAGVQSTITLPLTLQGTTWGALTLYSKNAALVTGAQQRLAGIASRLSVSLESARQQEWLSLLDMALTGVEQAVFISDAKTHILWANQAFSRISGYPQQEVIEKTPELFHVQDQASTKFSEIRNTTSKGQTFDGEIDFVHKDGHIFPVHKIITPLLDENNQVTNFVTIIEDISQRKGMEAQVQHMAHYDTLTDLPNRTLFQQLLKQAIPAARRSEKMGALLFIDLDKFKAINDREGHAAGDFVLVEISRRLKELVRESDTVARLGGDEFTAIIPGLNTREEALLIAEKIRLAINKPVELASGPISVGCSIGIAYFPQENQAPDELLSTADKAMYEAKQAGHNMIREQAGEAEMTDHKTVSS